MTSTPITTPITRASLDRIQKIVTTADAEISMLTHALTSMAEIADDIQQPLKGVLSVLAVVSEDLYQIHNLAVSND